MSGISNISGSTLTRTESIRQSIGVILSTPIGTRVMHREFGSDIFDLIDAPGHAATIQRLKAATAQALRKFEPRFRLSKADIDVSKDGECTITVSGYDTQGPAISNTLVVGRLSAGV